MCLVAVVDGQLAAGDKLAAASTGQHYDILEVWLVMVTVKKLFIAHSLLPEPLAKPQDSTVQAMF